VAGALREPDCRLYWAEVHADGPMVGTHRERFSLGTFSSPYPGRVLRWLRAQALRIADGLDPDPGTAACPLALRPDPAAPVRHLGDAPTELRDWASGDGRRLEARRVLADGRPFLFVSADYTGWYALIAWPAGSSVGLPASGFPGRWT
jgi:hypothetical protein